TRLVRRPLHVRRPEKAAASLSISLITLILAPRAGANAHSHAFRSFDSGMLPQGPNAERGRMALGRNRTGHQSVLEEDDVADEETVGIDRGRFGRLHRRTPNRITPDRSACV